ncbi:MAG: hypothetical protein FWB78_11075 [Treponema sp.]|nr:hypothetical protein [Treponema sp.]
MKKLFAMFTIIALVLLLTVSCGSRPQAPEDRYDDEIIKKLETSIDDQATAYYGLLEEPALDGFPEYIRNTVRNAPGNAILGIGTARRLTLPMSRSIATIKAMEDITRQLEIIARDMVTDYITTSRADPQIAFAFLNRSNTTWDVRSSSVIDEAMADDGYYWVVIMLSQNNVARIIELNADSLVPGSSAAMWSSMRLDAALERNNLAFRAQHGF